ncbi:hypothetical protein Chor_005541 [Crotalus horridus]
MRTLWIVAVLLLGVEGSLVQFEMMIMEVAKRSGLLCCCFVHDCCYGKATDCNPKRVSYTYSEENGEIVCGGDDPCGTQICECDKAAAICFRDNIPSYDNKYWLFPPKNCQEEPEPC